MRSAYKSPIIWDTVVVCILFAILGRIIETKMESDWKYFSYNMQSGGISIAVFFAFCGLANFIGTRFVVNKPFTRVWPLMIVIIALLVAVVSLFVLMFLGIENKFSLTVLTIGVGGPILLIPVAFFIRGLTPPNEYDR